MHNCFIHFKTNIEGIDLPTKFTFPFYYDPHPLSRIATQELQEYLSTQTDWKHNFGRAKEEGSGKMFGVLVVQNQEGELGYLAAFSGKLAEGHIIEPFVPPVFDRLEKGNFFDVQMGVIDKINKEIIQLENDPNLQAVHESYQAHELKMNEELEVMKKALKEAKQARKKAREAAALLLSKEEAEKRNEALNQESIQRRFYYKDRVRAYKAELAILEGKVKQQTDPIEALKLERKQKSADLQRQLFERYTFLNQAREEKSLYDIFQHTYDQKPPAGAGSCSAPKLLQYAFLNDLQPIALAEFWWGASPSSEIRKHKQFYPACRGKCEPILAHMLNGMSIDPNPISQLTDEEKTIEIVYETDYLVAINKPPHLLSVPGKQVEDSVWLRMRHKYPQATGPLVVHRLDMSTSGIMLIPKTKEAHKRLQRQFEKRIIKKEYVALLEGEIEGEEGQIKLPLRVDFNDRPRQLVCYEMGRMAITDWKVIEKIDGKTRIRFYPITGRTHQLRVHAAHVKGLNTPIIGDDLYGTKGDRLHLHAEQIEFFDPITRKPLLLSVPAPF